MNISDEMRAFVDQYMVEALKYAAAMSKHIATMDYEGKIKPPHAVIALAEILAKAAKLSDCPPEALMAIFLERMANAYGDTVQIKTVHRKKDEDWQTKPTHIGPAIEC